jgi:hypothetical protein
MVSVLRRAISIPYMLFSNTLYMCFKGLKFKGSVKDALMVAVDREYLFDDLTGQDGANTHRKIYSAMNFLIKSSCYLWFPLVL